MVFDPRRDAQKLRDNPQEWLKSFEKQAQQMQRQAEEAEAALAQAEVTLTSRDHAVTVTVSAGGVLQSLQLSPRAEGMTLLQLASTIMEVYQQACVAAAERTKEIMSGLLGEDSKAMDFLRTAMPATDEEGTSR